MKVFFLANIPSPYRVDFFNELGKYCDLTVFFERQNAIGRVWSKRKNLNYKSVFLNGIRIGEDNSLCVSITKYIKKDMFDIFIVGGYGTHTGMLAIKMLKIKKIEFILNCDGGMKQDCGYLKNIIKKHFISAASYYLSPAKITDDYLLEYGAKKQNIFRYSFTSLLEMDISKNLISNVEKLQLKSELGIVEEKIIICVGRIIPLKGYSILLKAATKIEKKDIGIYIIGGKPTPELEKEIEDYDLANVHFIDFMKKDTLFKYYKCANIFVFTTHGDVWGLVVNEAMANGLPVISSDRAVAALQLVKENINGYIFNDNDDVQLAEYLKILLDNEKMQVKFGMNSLNIIKNYSIENMAREHIYFFNKIIGNEV